MKHHLLLIIIIWFGLQLNAQDDEPCESHVVFLLDGSSSFSNNNKQQVVSAINTFIDNIANNNVYVSTIPLARDIEDNLAYADGNNFVLYSNQPDDFTDFFNNYIANTHASTGGSIDHWDAGLSFVEEELLDPTNPPNPPNPDYKKPDIVILFVDEEPVPKNSTDAGIAVTTANVLINENVRLYYMIFDNRTVTNQIIANGVLDGHNNIAAEYTNVNGLTQDSNGDLSAFPSYFLFDNLNGATTLITNLENLLVEQGIICDDEPPTTDDCDDCKSYKPIPGEKYVLSAWVKENTPQQVITYQNTNIEIEYLDDQQNVFATETFTPSDRIIDGWQRIYKEFTINASTVSIRINLTNKANHDAFFDDIRLHPYNGTMKSFVYDPITQRLMAELDENNYSTFYEYDQEGGLIRVKKETERGIYTIQETRSKTSSDN